MNLSRALHRGDLSGLDELALSIESNIFTGGSSLGTDLSAMKARLETLEAGGAGIRTIYATVSGTFSQVVDGFEHVSPDAVFDALPADLAEIFEAPTHVVGVGKLVTEFKWYYAALMDASDALRLSDGQRMAVQFSGAYNALMDMQVERVGRRGKGRKCTIRLPRHSRCDGWLPLYFDIRAKSKNKDD